VNLSAIGECVEVSASATCLTADAVVRAIEAAE